MILCKLVIGGLSNSAGGHTNPKNAPTLLWMRLSLQWQNISKALKFLYLRVALTS